MGGSEILLILLAVLILFGADKLPEFARSIGKGMREVKKATDEIKNELTKETQNFKRDIDELKNDLTKETQTIKKEIDVFQNNAATANIYDFKKEIDDSVK